MGEWTSLTLPTSTSLVIMTMLKQFSCHTILQKSYRVSCLGPSRKREQTTKRQKQQHQSLPCQQGTSCCCEISYYCGLSVLPQMAGFWSLKIMPSIKLLEIPGRKERGDGWQNNSNSWWWKPKGPSVTLRGRSFRKRHTTLKQGSRRKETLRETKSLLAPSFFFVFLASFISPSL